MCLFWHRSQVHNASASRVKVWHCWHRSRVPPGHSCQVQSAQQGAVLRRAAPCFRHGSALSLTVTILSRWPWLGHLAPGSRFRAGPPALCKTNGN